MPSVKFAWPLSEQAVIRLGPIGHRAILRAMVNLGQNL